MNQSLTVQSLADPTSARPRGGDGFTNIDANTIDVRFLSKGVTTEPAQLWTHVNLSMGLGNDQVMYTHGQSLLRYAGIGRLEKYGDCVQYDHRNRAIPRKSARAAHDRTEEKSSENVPDRGLDTATSKISHVTTSSPNPAQHPAWLNQKVVLLNK